MYDLVIKNGLIVDGTGAEPYRSSVCIKNGKISAITKDTVTASKTIDAENLIVSAGFIDIHTHSDTAPFFSELSESKINQGITTEIVGNCGLSLVPACEKNRRDIIINCEKTLVDLSVGKFDFKADDISEYAEILKSKKMSVNMGILIGHGTLRGCVMGFDNRSPTEKEMSEMKALLERELKNGAFGLSLGLIYPPGSFSKTEEIIELAKVLKANNGILTTHMRSESDDIFEAVDEMLRVAEVTGVHLQISHLKLIGVKQWHKAKQLLDKIENARKKGINVTCDQYPYNASSTGLSAVLPHWVHSGGNEKMLERLRSCDEFENLIAEIEAGVQSRGGAGCIGISSTMGHMPKIESKTIEELAKEYALSPAKTIIKIIIDCGGAVNAIYYSMNSDDVITIMKDMNICVGSDGTALSYDTKNLKVFPHPRSFGTFPRFLQTVRENNLMPIEKAVYKMTGLTANILGLTDRGTIETDKAADITIFDYESIKDLSTYQNSVMKPQGIAYVVVGGEIAVDKGVQTTSRAGTVLLKNSKLKEVMQ